MLSSVQKSKTIVEKVTEIALPIAEDLGLELWDVKFVREGSNWYLRVFIDKEGGVSLEDCESMSRALDEPLEVEDPISKSYCLEVCSPGIERELCTDEHLEKFIGNMLKIKLFGRDEQGRKTLSGKLEFFNKDKIVLSGIEEFYTTILRKNISRINLKVLEENE